MMGIRGIPYINTVATGQNIDHLRIEAGMSVKDMQAVFGFATPQAIYKWIHGTSMPTIDNLVILAAMFDVTMDEIVAVDTEIRKCGCKVGISIKPKTPFEDVIPYMDKVDMLLIMTVEPGFGGQKMMPETLEKVRAARQYITEKGLQTDLQVDGGVKYDNIHLPLEAGANIFVAGSAVFGPDTLGETKRFNEYLASKQNA